MKTVGLEFGTFSNIKVNDFIKASGTLNIPPNGLTSVSPKIVGIIISNTKFVEGQYIKKGTLIAFLENPEFISKQQEYLQTKANLVFTKAEVIRQKALVNYNAGVEKNLQKLQAQFDSEQALLQGLSKHLKYYGINTNSLSNSNITDRIAIYAPVSGFITNIQMHNGMYAQPTNSLIDIIDNSHLHLELDVFEKDIAQIKKGQKITYSIPALGSKTYEGEVSVIGKEFNNENKTIRVHGHLENDKPQLIIDLFINAKIWLNDNSALALPEKSIIRDDGSSFIYAGINNDENSETEFTKLMVLPGSTDNGYTAVPLIGTLPSGMEIVTIGAYYVYAQSKAGELAHEH
jgi:cobalt-zinc-cadmium efflux system membrane fusion protein